jgi:hypothetical protein
MGYLPHVVPTKEAYAMHGNQMKDTKTSEIIRRLEASAADLLQLKRDSVAAGISPVDILGIEDAHMVLEHLAGRLTPKLRQSVIV